MSIVSRKVLAARYRLMPYLYTAFFDSHTYGCPVARPLFFSWPADNTTRGINEQWMMGDALLVSPIMYAGQTKARVYFPAGTWYDFYSGRAIDSDNGTWDDVYVSSLPYFSSVLHLSPQSLLSRPLAMLRSTMNLKRVTWTCDLPVMMLPGAFLSESIGSQASLL